MDNTKSFKSACAYIRVSTDMQLELSPDSQKQLLLDYCKSNNYIITEADIFQDLGISGRKAEKRPGFNEMIARCKSKDHPYDVVVVWKFSRFARNQEESVVYKRMLKKVGVDVISISEPISDDIGGRIAESIFEIMDEYYSINLSQEVRRGMKENAKRGNKQSIAPYGYRLMSKGVYVKEENEAKIVKYIFDRFLENHAISPLCRELNEKGIKTKHGNTWHDGALMYILENPFYCGKIRWSKFSDDEIITDGRHEPIISEEMFKAAKEIIDKRKRPADIQRQRTARKHWLTGIVRCADCGRGMVHYHTKTKKNNPVFICRGYAHGQCIHSNRIVVRVIEEEFLNYLSNISCGEIHYVESAKPKEMDMSDYYKNQLKELDKKESRIKQAYRDGVDTLDEYKENKSILQSERNGIMLKIENQKEKKEETIPEKQLDTYFSDMAKMLQSDNYSIEEKNERLKQVVEKILYSKENNAMDVYFYKPTF